MSERKVYVTVNGGESREIKIPKPRLRLLDDAYARANGVPWACSQCGFIARGKTMEAAYRNLMSHFEDMKSWGVKNSLSVGRSPRR